MMINFKSFEYRLTFGVQLLVGHISVKESGICSPNLTHSIQTALLFIWIHFYDFAIVISNRLDIALAPLAAIGLILAM